MNHYKLRAECVFDVSLMIAAILPSYVKMQSHAIYPDTVVEFKSTLSLGEIWDLLNEIEDGHVMAETVQLIELYTGERKNTP